MNNHFPYLLVMLILVLPRIPLVFLASLSALLALLSIFQAKSFAKLFSSQLLPGLAWCMGIISAQVQNFAPSFLELHKYIVISCHIYFNSMQVLFVHM